MKLTDLVAEYGAKNIRVFTEMARLEWAGFIPGLAFKSSTSVRGIQECVIDETRYTVADGYKITLRAIDEAWGSESYYQCDLSTMMRHDADRFRFYVLTTDGYQRILYQRISIT